jgi:hypothetical protein
MFRMKSFFLSIVCVLYCVSACRAASPDAAANVETTAPPASADLYAPSGSPASKEAGALPGPGMEVVPVGGLNILVPKGMHIRKEGSQIIFEDIGEYLGRRLQALEDRVRGLEETQRDMERKIQGIEKILTETRPLQSKEQSASDVDLL